jgi:hypothetical protein
MAFDLNIWKERAAECLRGIGDFVKRSASGTPYVVYGELCTLSLWPLVEASRQGELLPVMMTLGAVAGNVGGNLIANQVQAWMDMFDRQALAAMMTWITTEIPNNEQLRNSLDDINDQLDTIRTAQTEMDAQALTTLRKELQALGNLPRFEAVLTGNGAIAQGHGAQAVGKKGVFATGNVSGNIHTGRDVIGRDQIIGPESTSVGTDDVLPGGPTTPPPD